MQEALAAKLALLFGIASGATLFAMLLLVPLSSPKMIIIQLGESFNQVSVDAILVKIMLAIGGSILIAELLFYYYRYHEKAKHEKEPNFTL